MRIALMVFLFLITVVAVWITPIATYTVYHQMIHGRREKADASLVAYVYTTMVFCSGVLWGLIL